MAAFSPSSTALVLIDLQQGILPLVGGPYSASDIIHKAAKLAQGFRSRDMPVFWVRVGWSNDFADALTQQVDKPSVITELPENWWHFPAELQVQPEDIQIVKHQWGAFYGTNLDLQLRRRGIDTLVLGGVSTNIGVESTARSAWEHGYQLIIPEDLCAAADTQQHNSSFTYIFPRIAKVTYSQPLLASLSGTPMG
ncbi:MAG: hydrolase [Shewanella sp.]|nr:hydrolase [Shewanella sp.]MCF1431441.1 hydrolase [Shewanella sp.]MCF1457373.1 hydrolase [Shewanella sp.]